MASALHQLTAALLLGGAGLQPIIVGRAVPVAHAWLHHPPHQAELAPVAAATSATATAQSTPSAAHLLAGAELQTRIVARTALEVPAQAPQAGACVHSDELLGSL
jgi:hypothetical protein